MRDEPSALNRRTGDGLPFDGDGVSQLACDRLSEQAKSSGDVIVGRGTVGSLGVSNRFYLNATFADRETRESVIAHMPVDVTRVSLPPGVHGHSVVTATGRSTLLT